MGASMLVESGVAEAAKLGLKMTVAVVDAGGHLLALRRMDGCMAASSDIATGKARSAALFARETRLLEGASNVKDGGARTALLSAGHVLMEGGIPIIKDGKIVAAIGVSGATPGEDQALAKACLAALESSVPAAKL